MKVFGTSDAAVRALSGVISVATLPVAWLAGRRFGGRPVAWVAAGPAGQRPLRRLLRHRGPDVLAGHVPDGLRLRGRGPGARAAAAGQPGGRGGGGGGAALHASTGRSTWSGRWALWLVWQAWRGRAAWRSPARWAIGAVVVGVVLAFLPWVPTFLYQARYTGTPWAKPPNFAAVINAITGFTDNQATLTTAGSNQGRLLALGYFALVGPGPVRPGPRPLARRPRPADPAPTARGLDLRGGRSPSSRPSPGGSSTGSAFSPRYASVVFVPLLVLVALGALTLADARVRSVVVAVLAVAGLAAAVQNVYDPAHPGPPGGRGARPPRPSPGTSWPSAPTSSDRPSTGWPSPARATAQGRRAATDAHLPPGHRAGLTWTGSTTRQWPRRPTPGDLRPASSRQLAGHDHAVWLVRAMGYQGLR